VERGAFSAVERDTATSSRTPARFRVAIVFNKLLLTLSNPVANVTEDHTGCVTANCQGELP
jgi:hypothetical protein